MRIYITFKLPNLLFRVRVSTPKTQLRGGPRTSVHGIAASIAVCAIVPSILLPHQTHLKKMKICTSIALLSALPLVSGQSSAPSAASPIESLSPSAALPIDSLVPTATVAIESLVPTEAEIIESLTPTETESIESLVPTEAPDTAPPSAFDSSAPSASVSLFESLVPTGAGSIESLTPTTTVPAIEASCSAHAECLMEGMSKFPIW